MRLVLLICAIALGIDAYAYSGRYTQAAVNEITTQVQQLASRIDTKSNPEQPAPPRTGPDRGAG
jgi:hypothetical protein